MLREDAGWIHREEERLRRQEQLRQDEVAKAEALKAELQAPGGVERYVQERRVPFFQGPVMAGERRTPVREVFLCHLPPIGVQDGDSYGRVGGSNFMFTSPEREVRGIATTIDFTSAETRLLRARIQAALNQRS